MFNRFRRSGLFKGNECTFNVSRPQGYKTFFILKAEHEMFHANKSQITNNVKFFLDKHS